MSAPILGIDVAKRRIEAALLLGGKIRNKSFKNAQEGFEALTAWLRKLGVESTQACLEATGNYGEEVAIYLPMNPATRSALSILPGSKALPRVS